MAITVQLTDDTTTFDLVYDASSQPYYHSRKGLTVQTEETAVLQHRPDSSEPVPIRGVDMERTMFLTADILGATEDEVLNKLADIKRMIDGADQQALRYHTHGDVSRVKVKMKRSTATKYTYQIVKYGHVDDSGAHYTAAAQNSGYAIGILVTLHLTAYGEGEAIILRNDLPSSPNFNEDSDADGLADGWAVIGTPTATINTGQYLIGGSSQQIVTDASTSEGFQSASAYTASAGTQAVFYIWMRAGSGDPITMALLDGSSVQIASKVHTPGAETGYDKTATDNLGLTWYRYVMSGTNVNANFRVFVRRLNTDATQITTFRVNGAYLQTGTTTAPDAWCSTSAIQNRYDPTNTSAATQARINYVDVWGVPGDSEALVQHAITGTSITNTKDFIIVASQTDGAGLAADALHWVDNTSMSLGILSGSQSTTSDATRAGGSYLRHTADASSVNDATLSVTIGNAAQFYAFSQMPHRVFVIARSSSTNTLFEIDSSRFASVGGSNTIQTANTWLLMDLGYITAGNPVLVDTAGASGSLAIGITPGATSATVDIDAILLLPCNDGGYCVGRHDTSSYATSTTDYFYGQYKTFYGGGDFQESPARGAIWTVPAGNRMSRFIYTVGFTTTGAHTLTDASTVTLTIYPRARHLLGTS